MRSQADLDLIDRDAGVPGLELLLDGERFANALGKAWPEARDGHVKIAGLRYRPGVRCLAKFSLSLNGRRVTGYARAHGPDAGARLTRARERDAIESPLGPGQILLPEYGLEIAFFPNDARLRALTRIVGADGHLWLLKQLLPDRPELQRAALHHLRYQPERRFVAQLDADSAPRALLKLYTPRAYRDARDSPAAGLRGDVLVTPFQFGASDRHRAIVYEWLDGRPLRDLLSDPCANATAIRRVGSALAELHCQPAMRSLPQKRHDPIEKIQRAAGLVGWIYPAIAPRAGTLADDIARLISRRLGDATPIHGDFFHGQVIVGEGRVGIVDLDTHAAGDPAFDLGLFIAHLERRAIATGTSLDNVETIRKLLLDGYGDVRVAPEDTWLDLHIAIGLLLLAPHHFRRREPAWPERIQATLERARELVDHVRGAAATTPRTPGSGSAP